MVNYQKEFIDEKFPIKSQTSDADKMFLLKVIDLVKHLKPSYSYLEIGSFLGGSLTPFLMDEDCESVFSVDERGRKQPDERGATFDYSGISNQTMIANLEANGINTRKLRAFDASIDAVNLGNRKFDIALIDGEHTDIACFRDFLWTEPLMEKNAVILFHDSTLVFKAISHAILYMKRSGIRFSFWKNSQSEMSGIFMGEFRQDSLERELGPNTNWQQFCSLAEKANLQSVILNRVSFKFEISDLKELPGH